MFKTIISFFRATNRFFIKTADVLEQATNDLNKASKTMVKKSELSKAKTIERYKEEIAKMVKDGGYESEEEMNIAHQEIIKKLRRR